MSKSLKDFIERRQIDPADEMARRALIAHGALIELTGNAYERGDGDGFQRCQAAQQAAFIGFALVHTARRYPFADEVSPAVNEIADSCRDIEDPVAEAAELVAGAEEVHAALKDRLRPTYSVSGVTSCAIIRGDHCLAAFAGMAAVNDN